MAGGRIGVEQWGIRIQAAEAEKTRRALLDDDVLDRTLKPAKDAGWVIFPVRMQVPGARKETFECRAPPPGVMPRHEMVGGIALMQEPIKEQAERLVNSRPSLHTVLFPESAVEGEYRTRTFSVLAGVPTTKTRHTEYGLRFDIDLAVAYFSARLANERQRIARLVRPGECVLDMFAGVGPFAIAIAERAGAVFAVDINPAAVRLMISNIDLNRRRNIIPVLADASRLDRIFPPRFDRIIMNLPLSSSRFLPIACSLCREGGVVHYYALQSCEGEMLAIIEQYTTGTIEERFVRSYSPAQHHAVYDIVIKKRE